MDIDEGLMGSPSDSKADRGAAATTPASRSEGVQEALDDEARADSSAHRVTRPEPRFLPLMAGMASSVVLGVLALLAMIEGPFFDALVQALPMALLLTGLVAWPIHRRFERRGLPLSLQIMYAPFIGAAAGLLAGLAFAYAAKPGASAVDLWWAVIPAFAGAWCGLLGRLLAEAFARSRLATFAVLATTGGLWVVGAALLLAKIG